MLDSVVCLWSSSLGGLQVLCEMCVTPHQGSFISVRNGIKRTMKISSIAFALPPRPQPLPHPHPTPVKADWGLVDKGPSLREWRRLRNDGGLLESCDLFWSSTLSERSGELTPSLFWSWTGNEGTQAPREWLKICNCFWDLGFVISLLMERLYRYFCPFHFVSMYCMSSVLYNRNLWKTFLNGCTGMMW